MDAQVGRVLDALEASGQEDNTIVVVWSDHGYHLGEKEITGKNTLWDPSTRVPLIFAGPGISKGANCKRPVELLDIYPTLAELCDLQATPDRLEGLSLVPQLKDADAPRARPAVTSHGPGNDAVRTETHRYIRYADGSEELYDILADPHEYTNLPASPSIQRSRNHYLRTYQRTQPSPFPAATHVSSNSGRTVMSTGRTNASRKMQKFQVMNKIAFLSSAQNQVILKQSVKFYR